MNTLHKLIALGTALALVSGPAAAAATQKERSSLIGAGTGAAIGVVAGGPVGLMLGLAIGAIAGEHHAIGAELADTENELSDTRVALEDTRRMLARANVDIESLHEAIREREVRLASAETIEPGDALVAALTSGLVLEIAFRTGSSTPGDVQQERLGDLGRMLLGAPAVSVRLDGYADPRGDTEFNRSLSEARARAVRDVLVAAGIGEERISLHGHGESAARSTLADHDGLALERRVEISFATAEPVAAAQ